MELKEELVSPTTSNKEFIDTKEKSNLFNEVFHFKNENKVDRRISEYKDNNQPITSNSKPN